MTGNHIETWRRTAEKLKGELYHSKSIITMIEMKYNNLLAEKNRLENEYKELTKVYDRTRKNLEKERAKVKFENLFQEIEQSLNTIFERKTK